MDHAGGLGRLRAAAHLPRPRLVLAGREERDQVDRPVARGDHASRAPARSRRTPRAARAPRRGPSRRSRPRSTRRRRRRLGRASAGTSVPSSRFATTTSGFSVSGAIPRRCADCSSDRASRRGAASRRRAPPSPPQRVDLGSGLALALLLGLLQRALDHREVGEQQLGAHVRELGGRRRVGAEAPHDDGERVGLAELRDALGARDPARHVDEPHLRGDGLLRALHLGEHGEPRVGDRARPRRSPARRATGARERREQRGLPAERHADEADVLHGREANREALARPGTSGRIGRSIRRRRYAFGRSSDRYRRSGTAPRRCPMPMSSRDWAGGGCRQTRPRPPVLVATHGTCAEGGASCGGRGPTAPPSGRSALRR